MTYPIFSSGFAGKPLLPFRTLLNFFLLCVKPSPALPDSCHPYTTTPSSNSLHPTVSEPFVYIYSCTSPIRLLFLICICVSPLRVRCPYLPFCRAQQWTVSKIPNWRAMADMFHLAGTPHGEKKWMYSNSECTCFPPHFPPPCLGPEELWVQQTSYSVL